MDMFFSYTLDNNKIVVVIHSFSDKVFVSSAKPYHPSPFSQKEPAVRRVLFVCLLRTKAARQLPAVSKRLSENCLSLAACPNLR